LNEIDCFLASAFESSLENHLGTKIKDSIKYTLLEKYSATMYDAINDISLLEKVLEEEFAQGARWG